MAPTGDYNPSLEDILSGRRLLISWETAFTGLLEPSFYKQKDSSLEKILSDSDAIRLLGSPYNVFAPQSAKSRARFDTATAAINITPGSKGPYDLEDLKSDALWLSEQCAIEENAALRVVILEWQGRPASRLLSGESDEEGDRPPANASTKSAKNEQHADRISAEKQHRRLRILRTYLSERRFVLKTSEMLLQRSFTESSQSSQTSEGAGSTISWIEQVSNTIMNARLSNHPSNPIGQRGFVDSCVGALRDRMQLLATGSPCVRDEEIAQKIEVSWIKNLLLEIIHIMQLLFTAVDGFSAIPTSNMIRSWYDFLRDCSFFAQVDPPDPSLHFLLPLLKSLVGTISLALLKLSLVLDLIQNSAYDDSAEESSGLPPYIKDPEATSSLHDIFLEAADTQQPYMSPAILAWSMIMQAMREVVLSRRETKELRQSERAVNRFSATVELEKDHSSAETNEQLLPTDSTLSIHRDEFDEILDAVALSKPNDDSIRFLAKYALGPGRVFQMIEHIAIDYCGPISSYGDGESSRMICLTLLELMTPAVQLVEYSSEVIAAVLAIMSRGSQVCDDANWVASSNRTEPASAVLDNPVLMGNLFKAAISRFPYETIPFLRLVRAFAHSPDVDENGTPKALSILNNMKTFTQILPLNFRQYEVTDEAKDGNFVVLRSQLPLFSGYRGWGQLRLPDLRRHGAPNPSPDSQSQSKLIISSSTMGRIISEERPPIAMWFHEYSGLTYLGRLLSTSLTGTRDVDYATEMPADRDTVTEIIGLFADLLSCSLSAPQNTETIANTRRILEEASEGLDSGQNIISVIFDIMEEELQKHSPQIDHIGATDLLTACMQFILALTRTLPGKVWPYLSKSALLGAAGLGGRLVPIVTGSEMPGGRYPFLLSSIRVYQALVEECIRHSIARKSIKKPGGRYDMVEGFGAGVPDSVMRNVLHSFQRIMMDVLQSCSDWRFEDVAERLQVRTLLLTIFTRILRSVFAIDDRSNLADKVTGVLSSSAQHLVDSFLSQSPSAMSILIIETINSGIATPNTTLFIPTFLQWTTEIASTLRLLSTLSQVRLLLQRPISSLEGELFKNIALFAKLYVAYPTYRYDVLQNIEALVKGAIQSPKREPPSLLGHMGLGTAKDFLACLSTQCGLLNDNNVSVGVWDLLSTIVSSNQQWFSVFLLTGRGSRRNVKFDNESGQTQDKDQNLSKSLLASAVDRLAGIERIAKTKALSVLNFLSQAEDHWSWAMADLHNNTNAIKSLTSLLVGLGSAIESRKESDSYEQCADIMMAGLVVKILGMYAHFSRQKGEISFSSLELDALNFYINYAISVPGYNTSLHSNLRRNFEMKFPGRTLTNFKHTSMTQRILGTDFFYDVELANTMLSFEKSWSGFNGREGIASEVQRANLNLSRVECQIMLLKSWKALMVETSLSLSNDKGLQKPLVATASLCLSANLKSNLPSHIFKQMSNTRADLCFVLMQRFQAANINTQEVLDILRLTWENLRINETPLDVALSGADADYVRILLRILLLALQAHRGPPQVSIIADHTKKAGVRPASAQVLQIVLDILSNLVAAGLRSLTTSLHDDSQSILPSDFMTLISLMQNCFQVPGLEVYYPQIVTHFADAEAARVAATLYSWSDRLLEGEEHVYGEISTQFLLSMSNIPMIAEHMAVEGILALVSNAKLTSKIRDISKPTDPKESRLYSIWVRGILPLTLNLLAAVGPGIAPEISAFSATFKAHISALTSIVGKAAGSNEGYISLNMVSEVHALALLDTILQRYRAAGPGLGLNPEDIEEIPWDKVGMQGAVEVCLASPAALSRRIAATNEVEEERQNQKASQSRHENRLEEMVFMELAACEKLFDLEQ